MWKHLLFKHGTKLGWNLFCEVVFFKTGKLLSLQTEPEFLGRIEMTENFLDWMPKQPPGGPPRSLKGILRTTSIFWLEVRGLTGFGRSYGLEVCRKTSPGNESVNSSEFCCPQTEELCRSWGERRFISVPSAFSWWSELQMEVLCPLIFFGGRRGCCHEPICLSITKSLFN